MLKHDTKKKGQVNNILSESEKKFKTKDNKEYEVKTIINSVIYGKEANNQMLSFYYLVLLKKLSCEKKYLGALNNN